jgi:hypothetical protein
MPGFLRTATRRLAAVNLYVLCLSACLPACPIYFCNIQRLLEENLEQQRMLEQLVVRLDAVERALQAMQEQRNKKTMFGGFLGPRGL